MNKKIIKNNSDLPPTIGILVLKQKKLVFLLEWGNILDCSELMDSKHERFDKCCGKYEFSELFLGRKKH